MSAWLHDLYDLQKKLNDRIVARHGLEGEDLLEKHTLAFMVELGELANETRCFKFWSVKPPSEQAVILEEYVDGLHFILSLGLDLGYPTPDKPDVSVQKQSAERLTESFLDVYGACGRFRDQPSEERFRELFIAFWRLGAELGFDEEAIRKAYFKKNAVNHERQDQNY
jgi:dimeric dUTPase (all-alpha-NTP-PPase superfamily)